MRIPGAHPAGTDNLGTVSQPPSGPEPAPLPGSPRSTYSAREERLLGGPPSLTLEEMATVVGVEPWVVRKYWRSLGFADVPDGVKHFTHVDVEALRQMTAQVLSGSVGLRTAQSLVRAQGHSMDRLVLWQVEALVEDVAKRHSLDDTSARLVVLDRLADIRLVLEDQLVYVWRRQLAALLGRIDREVSLSHVQPPAPDQLPLERAVGFIDIISYTTRSADLTADQLSALVQGFEFAARDAIAANGARVVKTIGDAVLFVADDLAAGARVATSLIAVMAAKDLPIRGSLVWGRVLSRSGDIFGPTVNLASRLGDVGDAGTILMDDVSAALLGGDAEAEEFTLEPLPSVEVPGLGVVNPVRLDRRQDAHPR